MRSNTAFAALICCLTLVHLPSAWAVGTSVVEVKSRGAGDHPRNSEQHDAHLKAHWSYMGIDGPEHWAMVSPMYMTCESGSHQSPIDIRMPEHSHAPHRLVLNYPPGAFRVVNNGHTIQAIPERPGTLELDGRPYRLQQLHFHEPSEHRIEGTAYPMEMHLVHRDQRGHIVVLGVLMQRGRPHASLAELWERIPTMPGARTKTTVIDPRALLPGSTHHYAYDGSLTTPPCTEGVRWLVLEEPIPITDAQVREFVGIVGDNARPIQPLHHRTVESE